MEFLRIILLIDCDGLFLALAKRFRAHLRNMSIFSVALSFLIQALSSLKTTSRRQCSWFSIDQ
jgi:hypothetical protein